MTPSRNGTKGSALDQSWALRPRSAHQPSLTSRLDPSPHYDAIAFAVSAARSELPTTDVARYTRDILVALMEEMEIERSTLLLSDEDLEFERAHHQSEIDKARTMLAQHREQLQRLQEERAHVASSREGYLLSKLDAQKAADHVAYKASRGTDEFEYTYSTPMTPTM